MVKHANPTRDFNNIVLRMKALNPDIVIPANYYNEYALLVRTMKQQNVQPKAIFSVLGGAASSFKFVKEFPDVANGIIDCNHWYNPKDKRALDAAQEGRGDEGPVLHLRGVPQLPGGVPARRRHRARQVARPRRDHRGAGELAPGTSTSCPTARRKFVNGQNQGAQPLMMQVLKGDIKVVLPNTYARGRTGVPAGRPERGLKPQPRCAGST